MGTMDNDPFSIFIQLGYDLTHILFYALKYLKHKTPRQRNDFKPYRRFQHGEWVGMISFGDPFRGSFGGPPPIFSIMFTLTPTIIAGIILYIIGRGYTPG
ncbi:hypothetical protein ACVLD2_002300 [Paenibacillus sp. PvR052]|nr:hypothetical protein [Paenibacillus sp. PvP091]MBP1171820.1 hypothetical protein [Paenibacillus sp. PvR098]MBP2438201.1 hypothetical protein [Paenibacillus sp. PvP052]